MRHAYISDDERLKNIRGDIKVFKECGHNQLKLVGNVPETICKLLREEGNNVTKHMVPYTKDIIWDSSGENIIDVITEDETETWIEW